MTPGQIQEAKRKLGLSYQGLADVLGYTGYNAKRQAIHICQGTRPLLRDREAILKQLLKETTQ